MILYRPAGDPSLPVVRGVFDVVASCVNGGRPTYLQRLILGYDTHGVRRIRRRGRRRQVRVFVFRIAPIAVAGGVLRAHPDDVRQAVIYTIDGGWACDVVGMGQLPGLPVVRGVFDAVAGRTRDRRPIHEQTLGHTRDRHGGGLVR